MKLNLTTALDGSLAERFEAYRGDKSRLQAARELIAIGLEANELAATPSTCKIALPSQHHTRRRG